MEPLLFGALISAVDPVATLSIMGSPELNCDPLLYRYQSCFRPTATVVLVDYCCFATCWLHSNTE